MQRLQFWISTARSLNDTGWNPPLTLLVYYPDSQVRVTGVSACPVDRGNPNGLVRSECHDAPDRDASSTPSARLRLSSVTKTYPGGVRALQNVDLAIPTGLFGLLGPNGAGKSTLMRTIATLQRPDSGAIVFEGIDVLRDKTALRRTLGYLPQEFGAYPRTSAEVIFAISPR